MLVPGQLFAVEPAAIKMLRPTSQPEPKAEGAAETDVDAVSASETPAEDAPVASTSGLAESDETPASKPGQIHKQKASSHRDAGESTTDEGLPFRLPDYAAPFVFIPSYLEVSFATCSAIFLRHPIAGSGFSEIPTPYAADGEVMKLTWVRFIRFRFACLI